MNFIQRDKKVEEQAEVDCKNMLEELINKVVSVLLPSIRYTRDEMLALQKVPASPNFIASIELSSLRIGQQLGSVNFLKPPRSFRDIEKTITLLSKYDIGAIISGSKSNLSVDRLQSLFESDFDSESEYMRRRRRTQSSEDQRCVPSFSDEFSDERNKWRWQHDDRQISNQHDDRLITNVGDLDGSECSGGFRSDAILSAKARHTRSIPGAMNGPFVSNARGRGRRADLKIEIIEEPKVDKSNLTAAERMISHHFGKDFTTAIDAAKKNRLEGFDSSNASKSRLNPCAPEFVPSTHRSTTTNPCLHDFANTANSDAVECSREQHNVPQICRNDIWANTEADQENALPPSNTVRNAGKPLPSILRGYPGKTTRARDSSPASLRTDVANADFIEQLGDPAGWMWYYKDPSGEQRGPFSSAQMCQWYLAGYFKMNLQLRGAQQAEFTTLLHLSKVYSRLPFFKL